ncbi:hypothetical protein B6S12_09645 [Helicobacter valdiviensis]|uniref:Haemolysin activator HlyB C-terminal domain-containing protein n=1 Tax=Helicobacter valdiviensis TaxID=1458358 RepID=A0A2W6NIZ9_9HELI|nr:ShlB/FhaC/HecB family hemolysin secretion/activation protein [Helicobacter valdiviensis]PZT47326.1 hypothetical protein B6S12_09645 [Helicobacter valdiviensis]
MRLRTLLLPLFLSNLVVADTLVADINDYKKDRALGEMINTSPYRDTPQNKNIQNQLKTRNSPVKPQEDKNIINTEKPTNNIKENKTSSVKEDIFKYKFVIDNKKADDTRYTLEELGIDEKMLQESIVDFKASDLSVKTLQSIANTVSFYLQYSGYPSATAYIPQQEIDKEIQVNIVFGKLGKYIVNNRSNHLKDFAINHKLNDTLKGKILKTKDVEDVIFKINENSGIQALGAFQAGENFGETDVVIEVEDSTKASAMLYADNYGTEGSGQIRIGATTTFNNVLGMGDTLNTMVQRSDKDQLNYGATYSTFWGNLKITPKVNKGNYSLRGEGYDALKPYGTSTEFGVDVAYPFFINSTNSLYAVAGYSHKKLEDNYGNTFMDPGLMEALFGYSTLDNRKHSDVFNIGWEGVYRGIEKNTLSYSVKVYHGNVKPDNDFAEQLLSMGKFTKLNVYLSNQYSFHEKLTGIFNFNLQKVLFNYLLDSSETSSLGGAYGVRAYPNGFGTKSNMGYGMIGLRYATPIPNVYITPFYEAGYAWEENKQMDEYFLDAAGIELLYASEHFYVKADFARAIHKFKGADGIPEDGENRARAYVSAGIYF